MADNIEVGDLVARISFDDTGLNKAMADIDRQMKLVKSEFDKASSALANYGSEEEQLVARAKSLEQQMALQQQRINKLNDAFQRSAREKGLDAKETQRLATQLNKAQAEYNKMQGELDKTNKALDEQRNKLTGLQKSWKESMDQARQSVGMLSDQLKRVGASITAAGVAIAGGLGVAVKTSMDFEAQLSRVGAIADATDQQLQDLRQSALDLGASTSKSASEVAKGQEELAALGFTVDEIIGAMPGVISAAEASGADMAQTAEVMASTLNIFGKEASEATKVADVLAQTANQSAADITDMQHALKYAGPPAAALGISLEELSAAIGIMTNAGMQGEQAGTTLRAALLGLLDPSKESGKLMDQLGIAITDSEGNFVGLEKLVKNLGESMSGLTDTQKAATLSQLVGTEAVSGMLSLMAAGPAEIAKFTKALEQSGGASAAAAARMKDNLKGVLDEMNGAFETLMITIGAALTPMIRTLADALGSLANWFNNLSPATQQFIAISAAVAAAFALIAGPITMLIGFLPNIIAGFSALAPVFSALTGPIGIAVAAIGGIVTALTILYNKNEAFRDFVDKTWAAIKDAIVSAVETISEFAKPIIEDVVAFFKDQLDELRAFWDKHGKAIMSLVKTYIDNIVSTVRLFADIVKGVFQALWPVITNTFKVAWESIKLIVSSALDVIKGAVEFWIKIFQGDWKGAWDTVKQTVQNIWGNIEAFLKNINLIQIGKDIMQGLIDGIASMGAALKKKVQDMANSVTNGFKDFLGINSPSKVTMQLGEWTGEGFALGLERSLGGIARQAAEMSAAAIPRVGQPSARAETTNTAPPMRDITVTVPLYIDGRQVAVAMSRPLAEMTQTNGRGMGLAWG